LGLVDRPSFDLQSHSTQSDGALPPSEVVRAAADAGVELLALSDHDTVGGVDEALAAADEAGIELVPTSELSALYENYEDYHVLGYRIDHRSPVVLEALEDFRADRDARAQAMGVRLGELGFAVDDELLDERRRSGKPIGRPHLAAAVLADVNNAERLEREGIDEVGGLIANYLISGKPGYMPRTRPTVPEAIELIHSVGGVAVWAHPFWDVDGVDDVLRLLADFSAAGLDGVEVFYPSHTEAQVNALADAADARGLLMTGSSDFHGPQHKLFSSFRAFELYGREPRLGPIA
jgi:hypothetical protein